MTNTDMFSIENPGTWTVQDRYSVGRSLPPLDTTNHYSGFTQTLNGGINTFTVERDLDTGDAEDYQIIDGKSNLIYSYGTAATFGIHGTGVYGALSMSIQAATRTVIIGEGTINSDTEQTLIHGLLNYIAWGWISFFLIITGRYSKYFYTFRTFLHVGLAFLALIMTVVSVLAYGEGARKRPPKNDLGEEHTSLSGVIVWWSIVTSFFGLLMKLSAYFMGRFSFLSYYLWFAHVIIACFLIIYSQIAILSGLYLYDSPITFLFYVHLGILIATLIAVEIFWQLNMKWKYHHIAKLEEKELPEMSIEQVRISDRKLAIFDQYVIDLGWYYVDHPGGKYVLDECVGKEIGKYFYGAYSLDNNIKVHKHSYIAGKILTKLAVGRLIQPNEVKKSVVDKGAPVPKANSLQGSSLQYSVVSRHELVPNVYRIKFKSDDYKFKVVVPGTSTFGRHYIMNSSLGEVSRYYTICNCMNSEIYKMYTDAFETIMGQGESWAQNRGDNSSERAMDSSGRVLDKVASNFDKDSGVSDFLELVIKVYPRSKNGLSKQLLNVQVGQKFTINGPMGKGLDLSPRNIQGNNVIFLGGTGSLPFVDLFAYLARMLINEKSPQNNLFSQEDYEEHFKHASFTVYGYYPTRGEAIAGEFISKVAELYSHFECGDRFKFHPIFTREGGEKLTKKGKF